jgi:hypothetical protein
LGGNLQIALKEWPERIARHSAALHAEVRALASLEALRAADHDQDTWFCRIAQLALVAPIDSSDRMTNHLRPQPDRTPLGRIA